MLRRSHVYPWLKEKSAFTQSKLSACHAPHCLSRSVFVPERNSPAPSVQLDRSQILWRCLCPSRSLRFGDQLEADVNSHICSHCVGIGSSDVRYWTRLSSSQVVVADARLGCRKDVLHWALPSTCALVDVRSVELGVDRFCHVCVMLKSAC